MWIGPVFRPPSRIVFGSSVISRPSTSEKTAAQISRAEQVINESQVTLLKLESDRQNEIAQSLNETRNQIFQLRERMQASDDQLLRTEVKAPEDGVVTDLRVHTPGGVVGAGGCDELD